jgi:hypothetical protein
MSALVEEARAELDALKMAFPLAQRWAQVDNFFETIDADGLHLHSVGLVARSEAGVEAIGSAAGTDAPPVIRAYFELLERTAILDCRDQPVFELVVPVDAPTAYAKSTDVFPQSICLPSKHRSSGLSLCLVERRRCGFQPRSGSRKCTR